MAETKPQVLVLQRNSITLTDLSPEASEDYARQQVLLASYNISTTATSALASNPNLQQMLQQAKEESTSNNARRFPCSHLQHCFSALTRSQS